MKIEEECEKYKNELNQKEKIYKGKKFIIILPSD
jgi:hypothetical protein